MPRMRTKTRIPLITWDEVQEGAACRHLDSDIFFNEERFPEAKFLCGTCPVKDPCLIHAMRGYWGEGVFGGLDPDDRRRLRRKQLAEAKL